MLLSDPPSSWSDLWSDPWTIVSSANRLTEFDVIVEVIDVDQEEC